MGIGQTYGTVTLLLQPIIPFKVGLSIDNFVEKPGCP